MNRDIELLTDMFRDEENPFGTIIETGKEDHYYSSFGIHLLKEFENNDHYYHFLLSVVGKFQELDENQKKWQSHNLKSYRMNMNIKCFCVLIKFIFSRII